MLDEEAHPRLVIDTFHINLRVDELVILISTLSNNNLFLLVVPVTLFHMSHNAAETSFLLFDSLCYQVILVQANRRWQIFSFNS